MPKLPFEELFGEMLDKYSLPDFAIAAQRVANKKLSNNARDVYEEIARHNAEVAGLPAKNTPEDRMRMLWSKNPVLTYHWTPSVFDDFRGGKYGSWDGLGTHSGTEKAAFDRMLHYNARDDLFDMDLNRDSVGRVVPYYVDASRLYLPEGKISTETRATDWNTGITEPGFSLQDYLRKQFEMHEQRMINSPYGEMHKQFVDDIFADHTTIPYINTVEDPGSISYITPPENFRGKAALFDPRQYGKPKLMDAAIAAPVAKLDPEQVNVDHKTARQVADFASSFVPVLGSAREAAKDFAKGDYGWGTFNASLAALEAGIPAMAGVKFLRPAISRARKIYTSSK